MSEAQGSIYADLMVSNEPYATLCVRPFYAGATSVWAYEITPHKQAPIRGTVETNGTPWQILQVVLADYETRNP